MQSRKGFAKKANAALRAILLYDYSLSFLAADEKLFPPKSPRVAPKNDLLDIL